MLARAMFVPRWTCVCLVAAVNAAAAQSQFSAYWHRGKAEVSRYELERLRYGQLRQGYALLIFVTEDFRRDKQVKAEREAAAGTVNVLKLNRIERFATGLYDYSLMASSFTEARPEGAELPPTLKVTASIQDWCGHTWLQTNRRLEGFEVVGHSYFEAEADERTTLPLAVLEDEVLTQIRLDPDRLPMGEVRVIPSAFCARLEHRPMRAEKAIASLTDLPRTTDGDRAEREYRLSIDLGDERQRSLRVRFGKTFPFAITRRAGARAGEVA
jgi:hypothetical protein